MRAVALADSTVQEKVAKSFIPLKVAIKPGSKDFPVNWPGLRTAVNIYPWSKIGFTGCTVVTPDLQVEYGNTGLVGVDHMFESCAYDAKKFAAMLDTAAKRWAREQEIRADKTLNAKERDQQLASFREDVRKILLKEGTFLPPPKGFSILDAFELNALGSTPKKK